MAENTIRIRITVKDEEAQKKLQKFSMQLMEMGEKVMRLGSMMSMSITAPIVGAFTLAIQSSEDLQMALEPIKTEFSAISQELGDALVPVIREMMPDIQKLIGFVGDLVTKFAELDTDTKTRIVKFAAAIAAIGPALMVAGQLASFVGIILNLASSLGVGASVGGAAGAAGAVGAAAGGGATVALAGFAATLTTVILPLAAVIALGYVLIKILDKIGAMDAAKETLREMAVIGRYGMVKGAESLFGRDAIPEKAEAFTMGGFSAVNSGISPSTSSSVPARSSYGSGGGGSGAGNINVTVNAPHVVGTEKELASALRPSIYQALRDLKIGFA